MTPVEILDATAERSTWGVAALVEYRPGAGFRSPQGHHMVLPNGTLADTFDEVLVVAMGKANMALWDEHLTARRGAT